MSENLLTPFQNRVALGIGAVLLTSACSPLGAPERNDISEQPTNATNTKAVQADNELPCIGDKNEGDIAKGLIASQLVKSGQPNPYSDAAAALPPLSETMSAAVLNKSNESVATILGKVDGKTYNITPGMSLTSIYEALVPEGDYVDITPEFSKKKNAEKISSLRCLPDDIVVVTRDTQGSEYGSLAITDWSSGSAFAQYTELFTDASTKTGLQESMYDLYNAERIAYVLAPTAVSDPTASPSPSETVTPSPSPSTEAVQPTAQQAWLDRVDKRLYNLEDFIKRRLGTAKAKGDAADLVINVDIDNTALQTYFAKGKAVPRTLAVLKYAQRNGVKVVFNTGRPAKNSAATRTELRKAGYQVDVLCMREPGETLVESKQSCRREQAKKGKTVILNIGNNTTDFDGKNQEKLVDLPSEHQGVKLG